MLRSDVLISDDWRGASVTSMRDRGEGVYECKIVTDSNCTIASGDPEGVFVGDETHVLAYLNEHPDRIAFTQLSIGPDAEATVLLKV
jgi:hypothetical protein